MGDDTDTDDDLKLDNISDDILFQEISKDWRFRSNLIYSIPSVLVTISSGLLGLSYGVLGSESQTEIRILVLLIGLFWSFTMVLKMIKHRYYRTGSKEAMNDITTNYVTNVAKKEDDIQNVKSVKKIEPASLSFNNYFLQRISNILIWASRNISSYEFTLLSSIFVTLIFIILLVFESVKYV